MSPRLNSSIMETDNAAQLPDAGSDQTHVFAVFLKKTLLFSLIVAVLAAWCWPLWWAHNRLGVLDWDFGSQRLEAMRATIMEFHEWPGNNPWMTGGAPLLGNPALSVFSIPGVLSLLIGTHWGLHLSHLLLIGIGFYSAWLLSGIWWPERWHRLTFALYVVANPAMIYHATAGHLAFLNYYFLPAALFFFLRYDSDRWSGLRAGLLLGAAFLHSVAYIVQYAFLIFFSLLLWRYWRQSPRATGALIRWGILFLASFLTLTIYRIATILPVASAFPRNLEIPFHLDFFTALRAFFYPTTEFATVAPKLLFCHSAIEVCCYLGFIASVLFVVGLRHGFRWWHAGTLILIWASLGNDQPWYLMYWIMKLPTFSSHLCFERIRVFISLFLGISAVEGLRVLWGSSRAGWSRGLVILIGAMLALEVLVISHCIMLNSHVTIMASHTSSYTRRFENWGVAPTPSNFPAAGSVEHTYFSTLANQGYLRGQGDSYILPSETLAKGLEELGYVGEFQQSGKMVEPQSWSPNKIVFTGLDPTAPLDINMNPGSPWHLNGTPLFPDYRIVELAKTFVVMPDKDGRVVLSYHAPGQWAGLYGTLLMSVLLAASVYYCARKEEISA